VGSLFRGNIGHNVEATRSGELRVPNPRDQAEKQPRRKDAQRKPLMPKGGYFAVIGRILFRTLFIFL